MNCLSFFKYYLAFSLFDCIIDPSAGKFIQPNENYLDMTSSQNAPEPTAVSLSQAIIRAVASRENVDATEIEPPDYKPLYAAVNPEALDTLFRPTGSGHVRGPGSVSLQYAGYDVTVHSDGEVELTDRVDSDESIDSSTEN